MSFSTASLGQNMTTHPDFKSAIILMGKQMKSLQREFGHVMSGASLIANNVSYPNHPQETIEIRKGVRSLLEGSLLVYLFAMWEAHVPSDVGEWLTESEMQKLNSFKHVRDSVAHKFNGGRATTHNEEKHLKLRCHSQELFGIKQTIH